MTRIPIEQWVRRLEEAAHSASSSARVVVLDSTDSTQDAARRLHLRPGDLVTSWLQTSGRGRLGRTWDSGGDAGVAVTIAVEPAAGHLSLRAGVAAARALEEHLGRPVGIKWPNDLILDRRKVGGVLIEQDERVALIGIGINVGQTDWAPDLAQTAVSLLQAGCKIDRVEIIASIVRWMHQMVRCPWDLVEQAFRDRDVLSGCEAIVRYNDVDHRGHVVRIVPTGCLTLRTVDGTIDIPSTQATVREARGPALFR